MILKQDQGRKESQEAAVGKTGEGGSGKPPGADQTDYFDEDDEEEDETLTEDSSQPRGLKLIWSFIEGAMISIIIRLNRISRHYRYVMRVLAREKIQLKVWVLF